VLGNDPLRTLQCYVWVNCLIELRAVTPESIFVHHTGIENVDFGRWLRSRHVNLIEIGAGGGRGPPRNRLLQLETFSRRPVGRVVLMDCSTASVGDAPIPGDGPIAAKRADFSRPPESVLTAIFHEAGLGGPDWVDASFPQGPGARRTDCNYFDDALYILAGDLIPLLSAAWRKWADWCLDRPDLFGAWAEEAEAVALALALRELRLSAAHLPIEWSYPIHAPMAHLPNVKPQILRYEPRFGPNHRLAPIGVAKADAAIDDLNRWMTEFFTNHFVPSVVWDVRYRVAPELGSGIGSRSDNLDRKRKWLGYALAEFTHKSVVDLGCGDIEVTRTLPLKDYLGLDVSAVAVDLARTKRPDWRFRRLTDDEAAFPEGDAFLCLEVLIHQKRARDFDGLLARVIEAARERLIVSGYDEPPEIRGNSATFQRPLMAALRESGAFSEISVIGRYQDTSLAIADKRCVGPVLHPNDMAADDFNHASLLTKRPDLPRRLADLSRRSFGFYSKHFARALEYSWLAERLEDLAPGRRVLDIGAGLNPLPLSLAERGAAVECVDSHYLARVPPVHPSWNECGFYDYGRDDPNLRAHNVDALSFTPAAPFDVIYSVSVIEHLLRKTWEATLGRGREWFGGTGRLLLTADLIPGTELLWNYAERREVEPPGVHGDTGALIGWLEGLGFTLSEWFIRREVPKTRSDLLFVDCTLA